jgi:transposase
LEQDSRLIAVVELSLSSRVVAGIVPGMDRHPLKKLGADPDALLQLIERWRDEAIKAGRTISRIVLAFEAGRDGSWLARWLKARGIEAFVIHSMSVAARETIGGPRPISSAEALSATSRTDNKKASRASQARSLRKL